MASKINALLLHPEDSVATVTEDVSAGATVYYENAGTTVSVTANEGIRKYHKIAVRNVEKGAPVLRYGENIGRALSDIRCGDWVHTHNLSDIPEEM